MVTQQKVYHSPSSGAFARIAMRANASCARCTPAAARRTSVRARVAAEAPLSAAGALCDRSVRVSLAGVPARRSRAAVAAAVRTVAAGEVASAPAGGASLEKLRFLSANDAEAVRKQFGTPAYVYDADTLKRQARGSRVGHDPGRRAAASRWKQP